MSSHAGIRTQLEVYGFSSMVQQLLLFNDGCLGNDIPYIRNLRVSVELSGGVSFRGFGQDYQCGGLFKGRSRAQ